jgi:urease alpha subunit
MVKKDNATSEEDNDDNTKGNKEDSVTTISSRRNYYKVFDKKENFRMEMEAAAATEQRKQAAAVNKNRAWGGGETLPKGTVLLKISEGEKNSVGVKYLPVVITGLNCYSQTGNIKYKVASRDGYITGMYSRGDLSLQQHVTAKLMGINMPKLKNKKNRRD